MAFIFHFIYGMPSFKHVYFHFIHGIIPTPLTNSYFSRWLLHHQPAMVYHYPVETALRIHVFCQVMDTGSKWGTFKRLGRCGCGKPMGKPWEDDLHMVYPRVFHKLTRQLSTFISMGIPSGLWQLGLAMKRSAWSA